VSGGQRYALTGILHTRVQNLLFGRGLLYTCYAGRGRGCPAGRRSSRMVAYYGLLTAPDGLWPVYLPLHAPSGSGCLAADLRHTRTGWDFPRTALKRLLNSVRQLWRC